jgi:hypothetical protein
LCLGDGDFRYPLQAPRDPPLVFHVFEERQCFLVQRLRRDGIAIAQVNVGQDDCHLGDASWVSQLINDRPAFLQQAARRRVVLLSERHHPNEGGRLDDAFPIPDLPPHIQVILELRKRRLVISLESCRAAQEVHGAADTPPVV